MKGLTLLLMKPVDKFLELLERSIIVQSGVTFTLVISVCYMYLMGKEVPSDLVNITLLVLGFWFGTKTQEPIRQQALVKALQKVGGVSYVDKNI